MLLNLGNSRLFLVAFLSIFLASCSSGSNLFSGGDKKTLTEPTSTGSIDGDEPVADLYNKALSYLKDKNYKKAAKQFEEVERQHPYSSWARRAILMSSFAYYENNSYDDSINAAQRFITLHPGNKDAAYAYYLIALSYYEQIVDVGRDQSLTLKALNALEEVSKRFPGTNYAKDAEAKMILTKDHLAGKEMKIGRYYLKRNGYIAAINRFRKVITEYQQTSHTPEALMRLSEAYMALGIKGEAQTAAAVLGHNYPDSQWYKDSYELLKSDGLAPRENKQSWISKALKSVNPF